MESKLIKLQQYSILVPTTTFKFTYLPFFFKNTY